MLAVLMGEEDPRNSASRLYRQISLALMENSMLAFNWSAMKLLQYQERYIFYNICVHGSREQG